MQSWKRQSRWCFLLLLVVSWSWVGCASRKQKAAIRSVAVRLLEVKKQELQQPIIVFGQTEPLHQSALTFQVSGLVSDTHVDEGDPVKLGQALATLDKESIKLNVKLSQARYWEAAVSYRKAKKGYRKEVIQQNYSSYLRAKATFQKAEMDMKAGKRLKAQKAISDEEYARYVSNYQTSKAAMDQAWQSYRMYLKGYEKEDVQVAGVRTSQARTQLAQAQKQLKDAVLRAPFAGTVAQRKISVGELVSQGMPAFVLMDLSQIKIRVGVPERVISALHLGQQAYVSFEAGKLPAIGVLERKGIVIDKTTLTYPVDIIVPNPIVGYERKKPVRKLLPGKIVFVAFPRQNAPVGISVPLDAVLHDGQQTFVFVEDKGHAKRVNVKTGLTFRNQLVIQSGLEEGAKVVVAGQHQLNEGRKLFIIETKQVTTLARLPIIPPRAAVVRATVTPARRAVPPPARAGRRTGPRRREPRRAKRTASRSKRTASRSKRTAPRKAKGGAQR